MRWRASTISRGKSLTRITLFFSSIWQKICACLCLSVLMNGLENRTITTQKVKGRTISQGQTDVTRQWLCKRKKQKGYGRYSYCFIVILKKIATTDFKYILRGKAMLYLHKIQSPAGLLTLCGNGESITGLWMEGQKYYGSTLDKRLLKDNGKGIMSLSADWEAEDGVEAGGEQPVFKEAVCWLEAYFAGEEPGTLPRLAPLGSQFRQQVWQVLLEIPRGETTTYKAIGKEIAARTGQASMSAQAIGGAVAHNPISIMIPCHRVLGADGSLTGYAAGLAVKKMLLSLERGEIDTGR